MLITSQTRISTIIKQDPRSIEAIAGIASVFKKLKNPILRKLMAPRVTLQEAAAMGGCQLEDFIRVLEPLGFTFQQEPARAHAAAEVQPEPEPQWLKQISQEQTEFFDVRELLAAGSDPLKPILQRFKSLPSGHALCVVNSFEPTPLLAMLEKQGARFFVQKRSPELFYTYFLKTTSTAPVESGTPGEKLTMHSQESFEKIVSRYAPENLRRIDVRHLQMPLPMQTILSALPELSGQQALFVDHKRIPIYLLEELAQTDFRVHVWQMDEQQVKLLIHKTNPA